MKPLAIAGRALDGTRPPFLIAEMSGNHNQSLAAALQIVDAAAASGADAIKLQTYTPQTLTIDSTRPEFFIDDPGGPWHGRRLWELYAEAHTPLEWHEPIFQAARHAGLACLSSAFDLSSLDLLVRLRVDALKIASFELVHLPLVDAAAASGLPLILSTGMATLSEIDDAVSVMRAHPDCRFALLKCTSAYPATEREANLLTMEDLRRRYDCPVGLSDHTIAPHVAYAATALGAVAIEKHLTLLRAAGGPDSTFSLEPAEFAAMSDGVRRVWAALGTVTYGALPSEAASLRERPSIYVVKAMKRGEVFRSDCLRVIRPAAGLPPKAWPTVIGKAARADIDAGTPLSWDLVEIEL